MRVYNKRAGDNLEATRPSKYVSHPLTRSRREGGHLSLSAFSGSSTAHLVLLSSTRRQRSVHSLLWCDTVQTVLHYCPVKDSTCVYLVKEVNTPDQEVGQPTLVSCLSCNKGRLYTTNPHKLVVTCSYRATPQLRNNPNQMHKRLKERAPKAPKADPRRRWSINFIFWVKLALK